MLPGITTALTGTALGDANTKLLLHFDGVSGSQVIVDSSGRHPNATVPGAAAITTGQSKFGGSSLMLNGASYITFANHADWDFGTGDFTLDWWEYRTGGYFTVSRNPTTTYPAFAIGQYTGASIYMSSTGSSWDIANGQTLGPVVTNAWAHFAVVRKGNTFYSFQNGIQQASWSSSAALLPDSGPLSFGVYSSSDFFGGYIDEFRISKGVARWTANFTPPTAPYFLPQPSLDYATKLLLHYDGANGGNVFSDSSAFSKPSLVSGSYITSTAQKKFGTASGLAQTVSDCVYINGTDPDFAFGTRDFTIEFWAYPTGSFQRWFFDFRPASTDGVYPNLYIDTAYKIHYYTNTADRIVGSIALPLTTWSHVAIVRASGVTKLYINGTQDGASYTDANSYLCGLNRPAFGSDGYTVNNPFVGYMDELRVSLVARWFSNFTPPSAPYAI